MDDARQLLNTPGLQAVLVETRVSDLLDNAEACIAAGKNISIDKPAGTSLPQLRRILESGHEAKTDGPDGLHVPLQPGHCASARLPEEGWLGEVFGFTP